MKNWEVRGRKQLQTATWIAPNRLHKLLLHTGWMVPLAVLGLALSILFWRTVIVDGELIVSTQVDYEDGALCIKFGFPAFTAKYLACKEDLLALRRSHEKLLAATSLP
jgi:hypothetical protein